jgi:hypothetical protein
MFEHFSSQDHVRKIFFFYESHEKLEGNFYEAFCPHNLRTQRTHTVKYFFSSPFFLSLHFRNQKEMAYAIKIAGMRNTQGKSSLFTIFFLSFFSGFSK